MRLNHPFIILLLIISLASVFRFIVLAQKQVLTHDEGISYLAATCHQSNFNQAITSSMVGNWVQVSEWKKLIRPDGLFCFNKISSDLARLDIHPPLYFWLLHLWVFVFGVNHWAGPALNIFIAGFTALALFGLARSVLNNNAESILVVFTWAMNPAVIFISSEARQYDLFTLWTVLLVWQTIRYTQHHYSTPPLLLLAVFTGAGLLTHYYFIFVVGGCVVFLAINLVRADSRQLLIGLIAMGLGTVLAITLHPDFYVTFQSYNPPENFSFANLFRRMQVTALSFSSFFYLAAILFLVLIWGTVVSWCNRTSLLQFFKDIDQTGFYILFFPVWFVVIITGLYLALFSPQHAMSAKYLAIAWPFFSFIPAFILRTFDKVGSRAKLYVTLFFYLCPLLLTTSFLINLNKKSVTPIPLADADFVVVDNLARGILTGIIWHIPDDSFIFVDAQTDLLHESENWLTPLAGESIYVSNPAYGIKLDQTAAIIQLIDQYYNVVVLDQNVWGIGYIIKIETP